MADDLEDYDLLLLHETERAILVGKSDEDDEGVWLAKSQIDWTRKGSASSRLIKVSMPAWLAEQKGFA